MTLSSDTYVQKAEGVIKTLSNRTDRWGNPSMLTTSKIRNILGMTTDIYNDLMLVRDEKIPEKTMERIEYLKIRFVYEAGRDSQVKDFVTEAEILKCLGEIDGSRKSFMLFARYMEALVAYHKYYGGKD